MVVAYRDLIELVIQRQMGIVGLKNTMETLNDAGLAVGDDYRLIGDGGHDDLENLMIKFKDKYGLVAVMGCKIAVGRKAREGNLALPKILA
jgi:hypothetical protein